MVKEVLHNIGVSEDGTRFSCIVQYSYDSGGPSRHQLAKVRKILSQEDMLGERVSGIRFRRCGVDNIRIVASDLESVKAARDALFTLTNAGGVKQL